METIATPAPMPGFLSRFAPPSAIPAAVILAPERLDPAERQYLMTDAADSIRRRYTGQEIDGTSIDSINAKIGPTFTRHELMRLLAEYSAVILTGGASIMTETSSRVCWEGV